MPQNTALRRLNLAALALGMMTRAYAADPSSSQIQPVTASSPTGVSSILTLEDAFRISESTSPELQAARGVGRWTESRMDAARIYPNPELGIRFEDLNSKLREKDASPGNITVELTQAIELGGKRSARIGLAAADSKTKNLESALTTSRVRFEVAEAFFAVRLAQEKIELTNERLLLAKRLSEVAADRVKAGKIAPTEETRLRSSAALAAMETEDASIRLREARLKLAVAMGVEEGTVGAAEFDLENLGQEASKEGLGTALEASDALQLLNNKVGRALAELDLERSRSYPDLVLVLEATYQPFDERTVFAAGFNLPLPIFDRNQGGRGLAEVQTASATALLSKERQTLLREFEEAHAALVSARRKAQVLKNDILPGLEQGLSALETAYRQSRIGYLDVVESQESLFAVREKYNEALTSFHTAAFRIEYMLSTLTSDKGGGVSNSDNGVAR